MFHLLVHCTSSLRKNETQLSCVLSLLKVSLTPMLLLPVLALSVQRFPNSGRFLGSQEPSEAQASRGCCRSRRWRRFAASLLEKPSLRVCSCCPLSLAPHPSLLGLSSGFPVQNRCLLLTHSFAYFVCS